MSAEYKKIQAKHGRKGGKATFAKHGASHMRKISKKAAKARKSRIKNVATAPSI